MLVECPRCRRQTQYEGNPWRPFCSERCKLIDLGHWADESYKIPAEDTSGEDEGVRPQEKNET